MSRKLLLALGLILPALLPQTIAVADALPPATQWIPQDAIIVVEFPRPKAVLDFALDPKATEAVTSQPAYQKAAAEPGFKQFMAVLAYLETMIGNDWKTALRKLTGGGVTFAASPQGTVWLIVDAEDPKMLGQLHEILLKFARDEAKKEGKPGRVASREYRGVTGWTFGGGEAHAIVGNRLLWSNKPEGLKAAVDLRAKVGGKSLASMAAYRDAKKAAGPEACATAFVNAQVLKQHPPIRQALAGTSNPLAALLFSGVIESLRESNYLALGLVVDGETLTLRAAVDGRAADPSGAAAFALPSQAEKPIQSEEPIQTENGVLPNLSVPRRIAGLSFHRDLHAFYAAKDELFPERTSGLIFFENMMGIFFSGLDLTDEVLGETEPEVRFVVAEQEYDPAIGTPRLQIPAFAAIFRLRNPEQFGEVVEEAWQKAIGLTNFTRGQQAQPGLIIDRLSHGGTKFTVAYFRAPKEGDRRKIDQRFNFRPSLAAVGDFMILSSTDDLTKDLIDALQKETADTVKPLATAHSLVEVNGIQLASILDANRDNLVQQNMLKEGSTKEQAETQIGLLITIIEYLGQLKLNVATRDNRPQATLELKPNL